MKRVFPIFISVAFCIGFLHTAVGQTATQDVTITVPEIAVIGVDGGGVTFNFSNNDATAGNTPTSITKSRSYSLFTNIDGSGVKVTGKLDGAYATGISLKVDFDAPSAGGSSPGTQLLSTTEVNLIESVPPTAEGNINLDYIAEITPDASPNSGTTQTVTYTVTAQ